MKLRNRSQLSLFEGRRAHPTKRSAVIRAWTGDPVDVDLFAGGGGASDGKRRATGSSPNRPADVPFDAESVFEEVDALVAKGVHVVFVAHTKVQRTSPPDQTDGYDRYELKLTKQVAPLLKEWADMVLFCNYRIQIVEGTDGRLKAQGGKERVMHAAHSAAWDAKNRFGLPEEMPMQFDQIAHLFAGTAPKPAPAAAKAEEKAATAAAVIADPEPETTLANAKQIERIDKFRDIWKHRVFITQIQAGGTGIDGLQTACNNVLFVESSWTPSDNAQAAMRVHRIGQKKPVLCRFVSLADSLDEAVQAVVRRKTEMVSQLLD